MNRRADRFATLPIDKLKFIAVSSGQVDAVRELFSHGVLLKIAVRAVAGQTERRAYSAAEGVEYEYKSQD